MLEYEKYWKFLDLPFKIFPSGDTYYPSSTHEEARARVLQAIRTQKRIILIAGSVGSGKTTLWKKILTDLDKDQIPFATGVVENPSDDFLAIIREVGENMGISLPRDKDEVIEVIRERLRSNVEKGMTNIWFIDECHMIKDKEVWERLRLLTNWSWNGSPVVILFLLGQPEIVPILRGNEGFTQRIGAFYILGTLSMDETGNYIEYHLKKSGVENNDIFTEDAIQMIYRYSHGLPRNINHICDAALLMGAIQGKEFVDAKIVDAVAAEREMLTVEREAIWTPVKEVLTAQDEKPVTNNIYENLITLFNKFYYYDENKDAVDLLEKELIPLLPQFIRILRTDRAIIKKAIYGEEPDMFLLHHCVNVAIQAGKVAMGMGYSNDDLQKLSLAALIHDIGMGEIHEKIWTKRGSLSPSEVDDIRKHPIYGYERLKPLEDVATVILQEHERMDGTGYPNGLSGEQVHEFAYIIGVSDIYDSLLHTRPYRNKSYSSFEAIKEIVTKEKGKFPSSILKSLIVHFLFPVGSLVELNSRDKAEVVEENKANPMRPIVKVTHDKNNTAYTKSRIVDLDRDQKFFITRSLS